MTVACPHFDVSIRQRSKGQSAVAGAAYMSAEKLFSEYDQRTKNFCYKEKEIVAKGILLPPNAPREYSDRQTLWNAVEASERQWNAQLARGIIMALPREMPADQYEALVREYCMEQFVSRGMIADYAIHDKGDGNPHAHVMLTMRAMDEHGKWLPKARRVYILDENGEPQLDSNGNVITGEFEKGSVRVHPVSTLPMHEYSLFSIVNIFSLVRFLHFVLIIFLFR